MDTDNTTYPNAPLLMPSSELDKWVLMKDWYFYSEKYRHPITVKKGFISNLDSVPRLPIIYRALKGHARVSAIVHDWLYVCGRDDNGIVISRAIADSIFKELMELEGVGKVRRWLIYQGVNLFGRHFFKPSIDKVAHLYTDAVKGVDIHV